MGNDDPLALTPGQGVHRAPGEAFQIEALQDRGHHPDIVIGNAEPETLVRRPTQQHVVEHRELGRKHGALRNEGNLPGTLPCGQRTERPTGHRDRTAVGIDQAGKGPQQGALAGTVGADHPHPLPRGQREVDLAHHRSTAEDHGEAPALHQRLGDIDIGVHRGHDSAPF